MTVPETVPERPGGTEEVLKSASEVHVIADEETPLLASSGSPRHGSSSRTDGNSDEEAPLLPDNGDDSEESEADLGEKKRRTAGWYIWRGLVLIVTVFLATIFIKGWIDGDVDVSF